MIIESIKLQQFRNYEHLEVDFHPKMNIFIGQNAQGKTNLLESIYHIALAKSHRTSVDQELIRWDAQQSKVEAKMTYQYGHIPLSLELSAKGKKAKVNYLEQAKLSQYIGHLNVVLFAPEDLTIVKGSPAYRRRFIDIECGQMSHIYLNTLSSFVRIHKQKNALLKQLKYQSSDALKIQLEVMNEQFSKLAIELTERRHLFIQKLLEYAKKIHCDISNQSEQLSIKYVSNIDGHIETEEALNQFLNDHQHKEIERQTSLYGPHRDDITFHINGYDVGKYGSQGQQRSTALSTKLAEIELIKEVVGEYPVLLLDDVLSELDDHRQSHLLSSIQNKVQTFVTTTNIHGINHSILDDANIYTIEAGQLALTNERERENND